MLTSSSKTSYSYARRILALPVLSLSIFLFAFKLNNNHDAVNVAVANAPFTLVVDAGHGGTDDGAVGQSDAVEKGFNLSIAKKVAELALQYGITVKMTRTEDVTVPLKDRMDIIKNEQPDACISIHVNATEEKLTSEDAFQVLIKKNDASATYRQSRLLGSSLIQSVKTNFPVDEAIQQSGQGIYVLDQNPYPAAIIECGYMNNPASLQQLTTDAGVEKVAKDILEGVVAYANNRQETTESSPDTTGKEPLYIVDGKEISAEDMKKVNTADIESVNVLKDKEAIAKYGKKGENGVVLITMKKTGSVSTGSVQTDAHVKALQNVQNGNYTKALKLIDDKIVSNDEFNKVNPDRIDKAFVLDGKAATKQYGDKGKNGAILVTMKKEDGMQPAANADTEIKPQNAEAFTGIYIVDGKEMSKEDFDKHKPQPGDIDNISVWKGEEAVKKYGEKGRNGVIVITSKNKLSSGSVSGNNPPE